MKKDARDNGGRVRPKVTFIQENITLWFLRWAVHMATKSIDGRFDFSYVPPNLAQHCV
jgi:hypothetical protein